MALSSCISLSNLSSQFNIDETGTHGTPEFPVAIYHDDVTDNFVNWHWHAEIEIGYVEEGSVFLDSGNRKYALNKGDIFFVNSNVLHSMRNKTKGQTSVFKSIVFDSTVISSNTESIYYKKYLHPIIHNIYFRDCVWEPTVDFFPMLDGIIKNVWDIVNNEPEDYEIAVRNLLSDFFAVLRHITQADSIPAISTNLLLEDRVQLILNYIHANYSANITLNDLAMNLS